MQFTLIKVSTILSGLSIVFYLHLFPYKQALCPSSKSKNYYLISMKYYHHRQNYYHHHHHHYYQCPHLINIIIRFNYNSNSITAITIWLLWMFFLFIFAVVEVKLDVIPSLYFSISSLSTGGLYSPRQRSTETIGRIYASKNSSCARQ